jgi:hypothetical protein
MGRSNTNRGRSAATAPEQMLGLKGRLKRALEQLNSERARSGLGPVTQAELAEASGLSQSVISDFLGKEAEKRPLKEGFEAATLARLCIGLDAEVGFILLGDGDVVPALARRSVSSLNPSVDRLREESAPVGSPPAEVAPAAEPTPRPTPRRKAAKRAPRTPPTP